MPTIRYETETELTIPEIRRQAAAADSHAVGQANLNEACRQWVAENLSWGNVPIGTVASGSTNQLTNAPLRYIYVKTDDNRVKRYRFDDTGSSIFPLSGVKSLSELTIHYVPEEG
jgi:hypothetical protein